MELLSTSKLSSTLLPRKEQYPFRKSPPKPKPISKSFNFNPNRPNSQKEPSFLLKNPSNSDNFSVESAQKPKTISNSFSFNPNRSNSHKKPSFLLEIPSSFIPLICFPSNSDNFNVESPQKTKSVSNSFKLNLNPSNSLKKPSFFPKIPNFFLPMNCFPSSSDNFSVRSPQNPKSLLNPSNSLKKPSFLLRIPSFFIPMICFPFSSIAAESEIISDKISVESVLVSIDNFLIKYPFVAASAAVIWLVIIPLIQANGKKFKLISAVDAFVKIREDPDCQLIDIRKENSRTLISSPDLKSLNKKVLQIEFIKGKEEAFRKNVLKNLPDPSNTVICVLDSFDDNSLKVAEILVNNGFKEAYAIKGGLQGKDGWQAIQEALLPPDVRVYPSKNPSEKADLVGDQKDNAKYPDLKPPSSPRPSKP